MQPIVHDRKHGQEEVIQYGPLVPVIAEDIVIVVVDARWYHYGTGVQSGRDFSPAAAQLPSRIRSMADRPEFQVQLKGAGVCPKSVRASDLAEFLEQLDGAITETAKGQQIGLAYEPDAVILSLVQVEA